MIPACVIQCVRRDVVLPVPVLGDMPHKIILVHGDERYRYSSSLARSGKGEIGVPSPLPPTSSGDGFGPRGRFHIMHSPNDASE
jgi:hypothetical protein